MSGRSDLRLIFSSAHPSFGPHSENGLGEEALLVVERGSCE